MAKAGVSQLTYADLQALPDDHHRYELIDGELVVSAAPNLAHQRTVRRLLRLLEDACPSGLEALSAPFDWVVDDRNVYEPDVLVARTADLTDRNLPRPPVLAVEVVSDFSRSRDRLRKRAAYQRAGLRHCWLVDPLIPAVTVLDRIRGELVETMVAKGDEPLAVERPFPVTVVPADLTR
jgi:Uma2 family endonuclease